MWTEGRLLQSGKYKVIKQIGDGASGLTYLAEETFLERKVVIKTPYRLFQADQDYEKFAQRFRREGQALASIEHPNIVQVFEYFFHENMPCLVMAYVVGETLKERVKNKSRLSQDEAIRCFHKLAEAIHSLHRSGLIHCDVHPGNIILRSDGEPVLIDFGSVELLQPGTITVNPTNSIYTPYEQMEREIEPQATLDIYALAATLYFALTGQKPQNSFERKAFGDKLVPPKQHCKEIEQWLNQAILQGMALEAEHRPASMQAWVGLLQPPEPPKAKSSQPQQPTSGRAEQPVPPEPPHF
ncbi:serine/threonine protein kinase, partial [Nodosilinea sp. LEGE 07298]|uniref:serine/threonine protein kinase n=1 Tax=Nodosilinea sp. LEGE 07298 TaxID=2777970 RepID=UPI0018823BCA